MSQEGFKQLRLWLWLLLHSKDMLGWLTHLLIGVRKCVSLVYAASPSAF